MRNILSQILIGFLGGFIGSILTLHIEYKYYIPGQELEIATKEKQTKSLTPDSVMTLTEAEPLSEKKDSNDLNKNQRVSDHRYIKQAKIFPTWSIFLGWILITYFSYKTINAIRKIIIYYNSTNVLPRNSSRRTLAQNIFRSEIRPLVFTSLGIYIVVALGHSYFLPLEFFYYKLNLIFFF